MKTFFSKLFCFCKDHFYIGLCHPAQQTFIFVLGRIGFIISPVRFGSVVSARESLDTLHKEDFSNV